MGMGSAPGFVIPVTVESLRKIVPEQYIKLEEILEHAGSSLADLARAVDMDEIADCINKDDNSEDLVDRIESALTDVERAFEDRTGINLELIYLDPESGDRYDDISGAVFDANFRQVYTKTPEALEFARRSGQDLSMEFFTQFG